MKWRSRFIANLLSYCAVVVNGLANGVYCSNVDKPPVGWTSAVCVSLVGTNADVTSSNLPSFAVIPTFGWNPLIQSDALAASAASRVIIYRRDCRAAAKNTSSPNLLVLPGVVGPDGRNKRSVALLLSGSPKAVPHSSSCCYRLNDHRRPLSSTEPSVLSHGPQTSQDTQDKLLRALWKGMIYSLLVVLGNIFDFPCVLSMGRLAWLKEPSNVHMWPLRLTTKKIFQMQIWSNYDIKANPFWSYVLL